MSDHTAETEESCTRIHVDDGQNWLVIPENQHAVTLPSALQAVVLWVGDYMEPLIIDDNLPADDLRDYLTGARAHVWAARLRYWADVLDMNTPTERITDV